MKHLLVVFGLWIACGSRLEAETVLRGAGATFPEPLYRRWIEAFAAQTGIRVDYQAIGSGGGIQKLLERTVDIGATDAFMSDSMIATIGERVLHVPTCVGAVAIIYNLPGAPQLRFTQELLADIFRGAIVRWDDKRIARTNAGIEVPGGKIAVIHRSEASGTTFLFTDYLSKVSSEWQEAIGAGTVVRWPVGMGIEGNAGVARFVRRISGSIGYVELSYAKKHDLAVAAIRNRAGNYMNPSLGAVSAAAAAKIPADCRALLTNTPTPGGYPISAFSYLVVFQQQRYGARSFETASALRRFLWWALHDGQKYSRERFYARLPADVVGKAENVIQQLRYGDHGVAGRIQE
jgi:phosphate transport system substrate-binding protein